MPIFIYFQSENVEWIGAGADNNWSTTGNWSTGSLPSNDDNVYSLFDDDTIVIDRDVKLNRISNVSGIINLINRKQAIKKLGRYTGLTAPGTFMILSPKQAQAQSPDQSTLTPPGWGN